MSGPPLVWGLCLTIWNISPTYILQKSYQFMLLHTPLRAFIWAHAERSHTALLIIYFIIGISIQKKKEFAWWQSKQLPAYLKPVALPCTAFCRYLSCIIHCLLTFPFLRAHLLLKCDWLLAGPWQMLNNTEHQQWNFAAPYPNETTGELRYAVGNHSGWILFRTARLMSALLQKMPWEF